MKVSSVVLCFLVYIGHISCIVFRIRLSNGLIRKYSAETHDNVSGFFSSLPDCSPADTIAFSNGEKCSIVSLCRSSKSISECNIKHGDLLNIVPEFNATKVRVDNVKKVLSIPVTKAKSPLKSGSIRRLMDERVSKVRIRRQAPAARLVRIHHSTRSLFDRSCESDSLLLLLGKSTLIETADRTRRSVNTLQSSAGPLKTDNVLAVIEVTSAMTHPLSPAIKRRIESALDLARSLNLTVLGCTFGNVNHTEGWSSKHIHTALQLISNRTVPLNAFLLISTRNATSTATLTKENRLSAKAKSKGMSSVVEAYQFSDQAVQLYKDGVLTAVPISRNNIHTSQVHLNGSVLIQGKEVSSVDATVLLVPVAVTVLKDTPFKRSSSVKFPAFQHDFPTFDGLTSPAAQKAAEEYVMRVLKLVLKTAATTAGDDNTTREAVDRLRDPHLMMYVEATMGQQFAVSFCSHLMSSIQCDELPPTFLEQLRQLLKVFQRRCSAINCDFND